MKAFKFVMYTALICCLVGVHLFVAKYMFGEPDIIVNALKLLGLGIVAKILLCFIKYNDPIACYLAVAAFLYLTKWDLDMFLWAGTIYAASCVIIMGTFNLVVRAVKKAYLNSIEHLLSPYRRR